LIYHLPQNDARKSVPHYDRQFGASRSAGARSESVLDDDVDAMDEAAQALREAEVEAVQSAPTKSDQLVLENMSIDELRARATELGVPNPGTITEQHQLIAAIRQRV
jgi:hypothetical protein